MPLRTIGERMAAVTGETPGQAGRSRGGSRGESLPGLLGRLADRHSDPDIVFSLRLAQTGLEALERPAAPAPAIAVIGPTQTGKSTVVNVIAGGDYVASSPLAAHTQRACLLTINTPAETARTHLPRSMPRPPATRVDSDAGPCLLWDTPDFDSNASAHYRQEVARVCALADLVVVVLSKEKYADQSVWSVLETLAPLKIPTVICLNKCEDGAQPEAQVLVPAIRRRLADNPLVEDDTPVLPLPRVGAGDPATLLARPDVQAFRRTVLEHLARRSTTERRAGLYRLVRRHWDEWVEPAEAELACRREWGALIEAADRAFLARYRSEYIDNTRHHDVAQKAILGLLELLEIPALAGPISKTRRALTWPFRRVYAAFGGTVGSPRDRELEVLEASLQHYLLSLRGELPGRAHPWWRALAGEVASLEPELARHFRAAVDRYRRAFQPRIDRLSEELYQKLEGNPLTLNALRATRLGADAGGILLAVKTGTLGLHDALFAPAMISLTSYLTESAVGQYLRTVIGRLKREQVEQVGAIVRETLDVPLGTVELRGAGLFGIGAEDLAAAREQAEELGR